MQQEGGPAVHRLRRAARPPCAAPATAEATRHAPTRPVARRPAPLSSAGGARHSMTQVRLAFLWHMHQPLYREPETGEYLMPWVRLHATRAYHDMAWMLERHPGIRCTVNFTPVLLEQLDEYVAGTARDRFLDLTARPAADLSPEERAGGAAAVLHGRLGDQHPAAAALLGAAPPARARPADRRPAAGGGRLHRAGADRPAGALQPGLDRLRRARTTIPACRRFATRGRTSTRPTSTTCWPRSAGCWRRWCRAGGRSPSAARWSSRPPYYHPILPLVCDSDAAHRALPGLALPPRFRRRTTRAGTCAEAMESHARRFGAPPAGMWPAEGSVSPEALEVLAGEGVGWACSDEAVLLHSLPPGGPRAGALYRPWRVAAGDGRELKMLFRDRALSDLIGFSYARAARRGGGRRLHRSGRGDRPEPGRTTATTARPRWASSSTARTPGSTTRAPGTSSSRRSGAGSSRGRRSPPSPWPRRSAMRQGRPSPASTPGAGSRPPTGSGSATPRTGRAGPRSARRATRWRRPSGPAGDPASGWRGRGATATPPRAPTGSGGTATTSPPSSWPSSTPSSAATWCRRRCWPGRRRRPRRSSPSSGWRRPPPAPRRGRCASRPCSSRPCSTGARPPSSSGRGPASTGPASRAARCTAARTPSGCSASASTSRRSTSGSIPAESSPRATEVGNHLRVELACRGRQVEVDFELAARRPAARRPRPGRR